MTAYRRVYDSCQLQADCQELGSAPEPYALQSSMDYVLRYFPLATVDVPRSEIIRSPEFIYLFKHQRQRAQATYMPVKSGTRFPLSTVRCSLNFGDSQIPSSRKDNTISVPIRSWIGTLYLHTFVLSIPYLPVNAT